MVKKKGFGGTKLDVKDVLAPEPAAAEPKAKAWAAGAGKAAMAPPVAASPAPAAPKAPPVGGKWARSGPQGLAATTTSLQKAAAPPKANFAPAPRAVGSSQKVSLGLKSNKAEAKLNEDDFVELSRPQTSAEKVAEKKAQDEATIRAANFPECSTPEDALRALSDRAGVEISAPLEARITQALNWFLRIGLVEAVAAQNVDKLLEAGRSVVHGYAAKGHYQIIQGQLEVYFAEQQKKAKPTAHELEANGLIDAVLYGALAQQLPTGDSKVPAIRLRLIRRLCKPATPASVQRAISDSLRELVSAESDSLEDVAKLLIEGLAGAQEHARRGAAMGMGAVIKGGGSGALKKLGVMQFIKDTVKEEGKAASGRRQGALLCLEAVASTLERSFEPHAVASVPLLLQCCSDPAKEVQVAARSAAKSVVGQMSPMGVRMLVNPIITALGDKGWRTRLSALELLKCCVAATSADGPKRLATLLPKIVPPLCEAAAESRSEVRTAARDVLEQIGSVVSHVDFKQLAPTLLAALAEPGDVTTTKAVDALLQAVFTAFLDAAALALIAPVVARGISHGSASTRKKAAGLVRALTNLVAKAEELAPFLVSLWIPLQAALVDQGPDVRTAAASAVGALAAVLPEEDVDWATYLTGILKKSHDAAELDGAALGLSEALAVTSCERREELLQELLSPEPRQDFVGRLGVFAHLPQALGTGFADVIPEVLPVLLAGLSDSEEAIRNASDKALSSACETVAKIGPEQLVAGLEEAAVADNPKARAAAVTLAAKLLKKISGRSTSDCRERLLVVVVVAQSDGDKEVRGTADRVWRQAVDGPPARTLKGLRPLLMRRVIDDLGGDSETQAAVAGRCAVDIHKRMVEGGGVLEELGPEIVDLLHSRDVSTRCCTCIGLREILRSKEGKAAVAPVVSSALQAALGDSDESVRAAAARATAAGPSAEIAEPLLNSICDVDTDPTTEDLLGLQELLRSQAPLVLPSLLAKATAAPFNVGKVACLAAVAVAPAAALQKTIADLIQTLHSILVQDSSRLHDATIAAVESLAAQLDESACGQAVTALALDFAGPLPQVDAAAQILQAIISKVPKPPSDATAVVRPLVARALSDSAACAAAMVAAHKSYGPAALVDEIPEIHTALLPTDKLPKNKGSKKELTNEAAEAVLPILMAGLVGSGPHRSSAAACVNLVVNRADATIVNAHAVKLAGPLVRAMTADIDPELGVTLVDAIGALLGREVASLKSLAPAVQVALLKYLDDKWPQKLHQSAAKALGILSTVVIKPEPLIKAICKPPPRAGHLLALDEVLSKLPAPVSQDILDQAKAYRGSASGKTAGDDDGFW